MNRYFFTNDGMQGLSYVLNIYFFDNIFGIYYI